MRGISATRLFAVALAVAMIGTAVAANVALSPHTETETPQDTSYLRVAHASPDAPAVDVYVDNETFPSNLSFGNVTEYANPSAGNHTVAITVAGNQSAVLFNGTLDLPARTVQTLTAAGEVGANATQPFSPVVFQDDAYAPGPNSSAISVAHFSPGAPAVDVTVNASELTPENATDANATVNGTVALAENLTFANATDYVNVPAGNYTLQIRPASTANNGTVVATVNVSVEGDTAYTAMAVGYLNAAGAPADTPFRVVTIEDATVSVHLPSEERVTEATPTTAVTNGTTTAAPTTEGETATATPGEGTETPTESPGTETETPAVETATPTATATGTPAG